MSYRRSAELYDLLYADKDYAAEAERIAALVRERRPAASTLLDVACGTGRHLELLRRWYSVEGLDGEPALLAVARRRLPDVPLHEGDMRTFELGRRFDVVTCLFSSIGYMHTLEDLRAALSNMSRHLQPGGLLLVEPWLSPDAFDPQHFGGPLLGEGPDVKVVRMNGSRVEGRLSIMDFHHLVGRPGSVEHFVDTHALALYEPDEYRAAFAAAGLTVEYDGEGLMGRGLWIGRSVAAVSPG
ncbi:MAG TPA: class I SAM-dependent methyltransferase [Candidatus Limnocylindria bacterium]|nr:class I SAM-dependent methyltransferase [Candidatus Limnocylindria bacterium]